MKRLAIWRWPIAAAALSALVLVMVVAAIIASRNPAVPSQILKDANFGLYYPAAISRGYKVDRSTIKLDRADNGSDKLFSYKLSNGQNSLTATEQAYPEALIYDKLTATFSDSFEVGTHFGNATVGQPQNQPATQAAVIKANDTLIFVTPSHPLQSVEWKIFFDSLDSLKSQ